MLTKSAFPAHLTAPVRVPRSAGHKTVCHTEHQLDIYVIARRVVESRSILVGVATITELEIPYTTKIAIIALARSSSCCWCTTPKFLLLHSRISPVISLWSAVSGGLDWIDTRCTMERLLVPGCCEDHNHFARQRTVIRTGRGPHGIRESELAMGTAPLNRAVFPQASSS